MSTIARYYQEDKNEDGGAFPGVPLGDIDEETFASYPEWLQRSVDASPMYRKTRPHKASEEKAAAHASALSSKPASTSERVSDNSQSSDKPKGSAGQSNG